MQKIYLEKNIDLDHTLNELLSISVDDSINYKLEDEGIRAIGHIEILGEYMQGLEKNKFNETMELDILAPFEKVLDRRDFNIKIEDFDYSIKNKNLNVVIEAIIYGVSHSEDRYITFSNPELDLKKVEKDLEKELLVEPQLVEEIRNILERNSEENQSKNIETQDIIENQLVTESDSTIENIQVTNNEEKEKIENTVLTFPKDNTEEPISNQIIDKNHNEIIKETKDVSSKNIERQITEPELLEEENTIRKTELNQSFDINSIPISSKKTLDNKDNNYNNPSIKEDKINDKKYHQPTIVNKTKTPVDYDLEEYTSNSLIKMMSDDDNDSINIEDELLEDQGIAYVTYHIYVVQTGDTYESISEHYKISVDALTKYNYNMELKPSKLVIIPYIV